MFLINTEIEVNWLLPATAQAYTYDSFDVIVKKPDGSSEYFESAIQENDFIAPTVSTIGGVTYRLNADALGVWVVVLTTGTSDSNDIYKEYYLRVSKDDTHIYQQMKV